MLHLTAEPRGRPIASSMYHIIFITTKNIAVDENWDNYMFTSTSTRSIIFLYKIIMHT